MRQSFIWLFVAAISIVPVHGQAQAGKEAPPAQPSPQVDRYFDFFEQAPTAYWQASGAGRLPFPGRAGDQRGFVRQIARASLSSGEPVERLLQSHPEGRGRGWIQGIYPPVALGENMRFRALVGFLEGTQGSDGARFSVLVREGRQRFRVMSYTLKADRSAQLDVDLSRWARKTVSIILRVDAGTSATNDRAVWVAPRLEAKPSA